MEGKRTKYQSKTPPYLTLDCSRYLEFMKAADKLVHLEDETKRSTVSPHSLHAGIIEAPST